MAKYHINPETGEPGICTANTGRCLYGAPSDAHYTSKIAARTAFELQIERNYFPTYVKKAISTEEQELLRLKVLEELEQKTAAERGRDKRVLSNAKTKAREELKRKRQAQTAVLLETSLVSKRMADFGGDLTPSEFAKVLGKADPTNSLQDGDCLLLARQFSSEFPGLVDKMGEFRWVEQVIDHDFPEFDAMNTIDGHAFVLLTNGSIIDSRGIWSKQKFAERFSHTQSPMIIYHTLADVDDDREITPAAQRVSWLLEGYLRETWDDLTDSEDPQIWKELIVNDKKFQTSEHSN